MFRQVSSYHDLYSLLTFRAKIYMNGRVVRYVGINTNVVCFWYIGEPQTNDVCIISICQDLGRSLISLIGILEELIALYSFTLAMLSYAALKSMKRWYVSCQYSAIYSNICRVVNESRILVAGVHSVHLLSGWKARRVTLPCKPSISPASYGYGWSRTVRCCVRCAEVNILLDTLCARNGRFANSG